MPLVEQAQQRFIVSGHITTVFVVAANTLQAPFTGFGQQIADDVACGAQRLRNGLVRLSFVAAVERVLRDRESLNDVVVDLERLSLPQPRFRSKTTRSVWLDLKCSSASTAFRAGCTS